MSLPPDVDNCSGDDGMWSLPADVDEFGYADCGDDEALPSDVTDSGDDETLPIDVTDSELEIDQSRAKIAKTNGKATRGPVAQQRYEALLHHQWSEAYRRQLETMAVVSDGATIAHFGYQHVAEVFSMPRVTPVAAQSGLHADFAFDIVNGFDLTKPIMQDKKHLIQPN
eukprot:6490693-Amphidinium_carterae.2